MEIVMLQWIQFSELLLKVFEMITSLIFDWCWQTFCPRLWNQMTKDVQLITKPANPVFQLGHQTKRGISPSEVRPRYTCTAAVMLFKDCEFGDYPPITKWVDKDRRRWFKWTPKQSGGIPNFSQWHNHYATGGNIW